MSSPSEQHYNQQQKEILCKTWIPKDLLNIFASYSCIGPARYVFDEDAFHVMQYLPKEIDRLKYVSEHVHQTIFSSDDLPWIVSLEIVWIRYILVLSGELSRLPLYSLAAYIEPTIEPKQQKYGDTHERMDWTPVRYEGRIFGHAVTLNTHRDRAYNEVPFPIHSRLYGFFHCEYEDNDIGRPLIRRHFYLSTHVDIT